MGYLLNSKAKYVLKYAVEKCEDPNIKEIMQNAEELCDKNLKGTKEIFDSVIGDMISTYAASKVNVMRKDLMLALTHLSGEVLLLAKDAADIMIKKGWFEEMPKNVDRYDIIDGNEDKQ